MKKIDKIKILQLECELGTLKKMSSELYSFIKVRDDKRMELERKLMELNQKIANHPMYLDYLTFKKGPKN